MIFDHWIMPLVQYATQKQEQNNKGKWKLSNLINNKCEKDESTRSREIIILTEMRPMIKGNRKKTNHHQRCFENQDRNTFFLGFDFSKWNCCRFRSFVHVGHAWRYTKSMLVLRSQVDSHRSEHEQQETGTQTAHKKKINQKLNTIKCASISQVPIWWQCSSANRMKY